MLTFWRFFTNVATFSETSAVVTSKKCVVKQAINNLKPFKNFKLICSHFFVFALY